MRYTNKEGTTLTLNECMTADSFFMEADTYTYDPLEMYFNQKEELRAGKKPQKAATLSSNDSERIPAEVQPRTRREGSQLLNVPLPSSYRVDDEGITNNYAILPTMSLAKYPSPEQQRRYAFQGAVAMLFVALTLLTASAVS